MATMIITYLFYILCHGTHPILDSVASIVSDFTIDCIDWNYFIMNLICFKFLHLIQYVAIELILNLTMNCRFFYRMITQSKLATHRKFNRLWHRCYQRNKILLVSYFDFYYAHSSIQIKLEYGWQVQRISHSHQLNDM